MKKITSESNTETKASARKLAGTFYGGDVVALVGDLGAGKTTFVQGIASFFGISEGVSSPTFTLVQEYNVIHPKSKIQKIVHIDCYRLEDSRELIDIGIEEFFERDDVVVIIEWAEKVKEVLPTRTRWITFGYGKEINERIITIED